MGAETKIELAHHKFDPFAQRNGYHRRALAWNDAAIKLGVRHRVLCDSPVDVFNDQMNPKFLANLIQLISQTKNLDWLLLTKRIGDAQKMLDDAVGLASRAMFGWSSGNGWEGFKNLWLGVKVSNQEEADRDIPKLLAIPAATRFLSIEPMLGLINPLVFTSREYHRRLIGAPQGIRWVIVGGDDRPMHPAWVRSIRDGCVSAGVPFFFKQWGEWAPYVNEAHYTYSGEEKHAHAWVDSNDGSSGKCWIIDDDGTWANFTGNPLNDENEVRGSVHIMGRYGKKYAGRLLDGRTWDEVPT